MVNNWWFGFTSTVAHRGRHPFPFLFVKGVGLVPVRFGFRLLVSFVICIASGLGLLYGVFHVVFFSLSSIKNRRSKWEKLNTSFFNKNIHLSADGDSWLAVRVQALYV